MRHLLKSGLFLFCFVHLAMATLQSAERYPRAMAISPRGQESYPKASIDQLPTTHASLPSVENASCASDGINPMRRLVIALKSLRVKIRHALHKSSKTP